MSRRAKQKEDAGLGDSLSSSFSSSSSSLTSSIIVFSHHPDGKDNSVYENISFTREEKDLEESKSLMMNTDKFSLGHGRSYESLLEKGMGSFDQSNQRKQSEAFTKALKKFSSLSNSNISIKLPSFTFPIKPQSTPESKPCKSEKNVNLSEKTIKQSKSLSTGVTQTESRVSQTISTQTEDLETHGLQIISEHGSYDDNIDTLYWGSRDLYYSTQFSQCYQMYSTLV